nr:hypothetical protein CFP56_22011 [Quercus suber]
MRTTFRHGEQAEIFVPEAVVSSRVRQPPCLCLKPERGQLSSVGFLSCPGPHLPWPPARPWAAGSPSLIRNLKVSWTTKAPGRIVRRWLAAVSSGLPVSPLWSIGVCPSARRWPAGGDVQVPGPPFVHHGNLLSSLKVAEAAASMIDATCTTASMTMHIRNGMMLPGYDGRRGIDSTSAHRLPLHVSPPCAYQLGCVGRQASRAELGSREGDWCSRRVDCPVMVWAKLRILTCCMIGIPWLPVEARGKRDHPASQPTSLTKRLLINMVSTDYLHMAVRGSWFVVHGLEIMLAHRPHGGIGRGYDVSMILRLKRLSQ